MFHLSFINNSDSAGEDCLKKPNAKYSGPFGATQMWNDLVKAFRVGMPLQKHRKALKRYDECFMSSDAINWFHLHIRNSSDFSVSITRSQVELLLKKFYDAKVFEEVDKSRTGFQSGNKLYRFCGDENMADLSRLLQSEKTSPSNHHQSSIKPLKSYFKPSMNKMFLSNQKSSQTAARNTPLKTLNMSFPIQSSTSTVASNKQSASKNRFLTAFDSENDPRVLVNAGRKLNSSNIHSGLPQGMNNTRGKVKDISRGKDKNIVKGKDTVRNNFLKSFNSLVEQKNFNQLIERISCDSDWIIHNVSNINKNAIPTNIHKKDQLPLWFVTALKSLASGSLNEKLCGDTIDVVCDFIKLQDNKALVTKDLFDIMKLSFNYLEARHRNSNQPPIEPPSHGSWKDIYKLRFNWKRTEKTEDRSRGVVSTFESFDFIDSSMNLQTDKSLINLRKEEHDTNESKSKNLNSSSSSKPLSFLGGVKQLKRNKKEKKLKNYTSLLMGRSDTYEDLKVQGQLSTSIKDLSRSKVEEIPHRNGVRSEENLFRRSSAGRDFNFLKGSSETTKMIEILQHVFLLIPPKHRRMVMIMIRLLAKSRNTCQGFLQVDKLVDTFLGFILISQENIGSEVVIATNIFNFMMDFYSEIFKIPQTVAESVHEHLSKDKTNDKENTTIHVTATRSRDKMADVNFPKSILKKPMFQAVRF